MLGSLKAWFLALSTTAKLGVITALVITGGVANAANNPSKPVVVSNPKPSSAVQGDHVVCMAAKTVTTETQSIPFDKTTKDDPNSAKGQTYVLTSGVNGTKTQTFSVITYNPTGCQPNSKTLISDEVTVAPAAEVTAVGSREAPPPTAAPATQPSPAANQPACQNGSYINTDGVTVCSPGTSSNGATAKCVDGTYSYSLHRSGTCSHHGGVATWL